MIIRPSDTSINALNYDGGVGHYTNMNKVCDLLGVAPFTADTIKYRASATQL